MKILIDWFSLIAGSGERDNLQDMIEDNPFRLVLALLAVLLVFVGSVGLIVYLII